MDKTDHFVLGFAVGVLCIVPLLLLGRAKYEHDLEARHTAKHSQDTEMITNMRAATNELSGLLVHCSGLLTETRDSLWVMRMEYAPKTPGFGPVQARKP